MNPYTHNPYREKSLNKSSDSGIAYCLYYLCLLCWITVKGMALIGFRVIKWCSHRSFMKG